MDLIESIIELVPVLTVLIALAATGAAWRSASLSRKATQSQLYIMFISEYANSQMSTDIFELVEWKKREDEGQEQIERYLRFRKKKDHKQNQLEQSRRRVKYYFHKAFTLYKNDLIKKKTLQQICNVNGIDLLYDVCKPLEVAIAEHEGISPETDWFEELEAICPRLED